MNNFLKKKIEGRRGFTILIGVFLMAVSAIWISYKNFQSEISWPPISFSFILAPKLQGVKQFSSEEEFKSYLKEAKAMVEYSGWELGLKEARISALSIEAPLMAEKAVLPERISETTVQVPGIDEPDIVKTDGKEIYFSPGRVWPIWREPIIMERVIPPYLYKEPKTKVIKAFPPDDLTLDSEIAKSGDLLLLKDKNVLIIFSGREIFGYDVSNSKKPKKIWEIKLEEKNSIVTARLYRDKIYLVTKNLIDEFKPCPIKPLSIEGKEIEIQCSEIYHPIVPIPADVTFLAMILDPSSGQIEKKISFVSSSGQSVVYMSENAIYITYSYNESIIKFFSQFLEERCQDLIPNWVLEKIKRLEGYDISQPAKLFELEGILEKYQSSLDEDERLRIENELINRISDYYKEKKRELEKSGILKIGLEKFEIVATGYVPGYPLNQFALDEYQENLRIATTIGERFDWFGFGMGRGESANDVYVLDKNLKIIGSVKDLGLKERIYSVRFIEDKGYLVTFREIDPFYVLDLSNPQEPQLKGELKIPGYSSYLHPISKDKILGIGKEDWKVKISLFDVALAENPKELDKYILDESWSDILNTHHAFLLDKKHEIFFLPGSQGGYVFSYQNDKLGLVKAIREISAKRAIYLADFLYIIGDNKITILNEINWQKVKELGL